MELNGNFLWLSAIHKWPLRLSSKDDNYSQGITTSQENYKNINMKQELVQ